MQLRYWLCSLLLFSKFGMAQNTNALAPEDDLGDATDAYQEHFFEALKQSGIENYEKANASLLKGLAINGQSDILFFELGKNYNRLEQFELAEEALLKAAMLKPNNQWIEHELLKAYVGQFKTKESIATAEKLSSKHNRYKEALVHAYVNANQMDKAKQLLDELEAKSGLTDSTANLRLSIETNESPKHLDGDISENELLKALRTEQSAATIESLNKQLLERLNRNPNLLINTTDTEQLPASTNVLIGDFFSKQGNIQQALKFYNHGIAQSNYLAYKGALTLKKESEDLTYVIEKSKAVTELFPSQPEGYYFLGWGLNKKENFETAIENLRLGLDYLLDNPELEYAIYTELLIAYTFLKNTARLEEVKQKINALKTKI